MPTISAQFGANVLAMREAKGMSQEFLAKAAAMDRSYLSRIENGKMKVSLDKVYHIASALKCPIHELLP